MDNLKDIHRQMVRLKESIRKRNAKLSKPEEHQNNEMRKMAEAEQHSLGIYQGWMEELIAAMDSAIQKLDQTVG